MDLVAVLPDAALVPPAALPLRSQPGSARGETRTRLQVAINYLLCRSANEASRACRQLLGFPLPEDGYWNEHTVAAVGQRYPEMEMQPYADALPAPRL